MLKTTEAPLSKPAGGVAPSEPRVLKLACAALLAALTLVYFLLWYNRFLGLSANGWFYFFAQRMLQGAIPYRDFYLYVPPLHPLKFAMLSAVFGDGLIVPRIAAVAERVGLALLVYFWLLRVFSAVPALLGSFLGILVFSSDQADALSLHHHDSVLWAVAAGVLASFALSSGRPAAFAAGSGFFASLCFFTKQTTGAGVSLVIPLVLAVAVTPPRTVKRAGGLLLAYGAGWILPAGCILAWLMRNGALRAFVEQVFTKGPTSKGPLWMVLSRPLLQVVRYPFYSFCVVLALILLWLVRKQLKRPAPVAFQGRFAGWSAGLAAAAMLGGILLVRPGGEALAGLAFILSIALVLAAFLGSIWVFLPALVGALKDPLPARTAQFLLLAGVSAAVATMLSLSWIAYGPMAMPGLALIIALVVQNSLASDALGPKFRILAFTGFAILMLVQLKLTVPFRWEGWTDSPVFETSVEPRIPLLRGFRMSPRAAGFFERVTEAVQANSQPGDRIFVFPWAPLIYSFTQRNPSTFAYVHWFDVTPDYLARQDAAELRRNPPRVIVYFRLAPGEVEREEHNFRAGGSSGQRDLIRAIEDLAATYRLVDTVKEPDDDRLVYIYAR